MPNPLAPLAFSLFGPFRVRVNGLPLPRLRAHKGDALLALLTLRHDREVDRAWLAGMLWPDCSTSHGLSTMRRYLTDLRRALGPEARRLCSPTSHSLRLDLTGAAADVIAFDAAMARGDRESLEEAVALYQGPLLEEWTEEWVFEERQAREQRYLEALEELAADAIARGDLGGAERHLRRVVVVDPLRESAQRRLMEVLAAVGSYAAATQLYRELRLRLQRELSVEPAAETRTMYDTIRAEAREKAVPSARCPVPSSAVAGRPASFPPGTGHWALGTGSGATLTFLLTDIEGSTRHRLDHPDAMRQVLARHDDLAVATIEQHDGLLVKQRGEGDSLFAVFVRATDAVAAALELQQAFVREPWPAEIPLKVRVALHTGEAEVRAGDYYGLAVNHCARLRAVGHGGQTLLSQTTAGLAGEDLPAGVSLRELGAHRLKDLQRPEPLFQLVHPELPAEFPPLRSLEAFAHNLPVQLTSFVGREREIAEVKRLLPSTHLLTLTGAGGCGKTRLALQVAADLAGEYGDGLWLVELAALSDAGLVPQTVAAALGVREEPGRPLTETLADALRARSLLLVLDNCEHQLSACAQLAETLLLRCANLRILATSREGLRIDGETTYRVPPLSLPDLKRLPPVAMPTQFEAVQLFVERAMAAVPSFTLNDQNAGAVAQVCHRLDGIPLAIELAAARVKALPVETIAARLDDMFRLLIGGSRTALPRHQTLQGCVRWSYELLSEPERALFRRLSVFAGGFTLEAAEAVCAQTRDEERDSSSLIPEDVLDLLTSLVEKSLVQYQERDGEVRYRLLEPMRQYAEGRLIESHEAERVRDRHLEFFLQMAERAEPELRRHAQFEWLDRLEREHDNLRAALEWSQAEADSAQPARSGGSELRLAGALWWFWLKRSYFHEGRQRIEGALARGGEAPAPARLKALLAAGMLANFPGDYLEGDRFFGEARALARAAGYPWGVAMSLLGLAMSAILRMFATGSRQECERAAALAEEALSVARETEDKWLIACTLRAPGFVAELQGDYARAIACFDEMLALSREVGDAWQIADALSHLARLADYQGDPERARALFQEGLVFCRQLEEKRTAIACLTGLAELAAIQQQAERAARLWGAAEALCEASHNARGSAQAFWHASHGQNVAAARAALGEGAFEAAWAAGRAMSLASAVAFALER